MDYTKLHSNTFGATKVNSYDQGLRSYMIAVYKYMAIALALTGLVAWGVSSSPQLMATIFNTPLLWLVVLAPFGMVIFMSARFMYMRSETVKLCLWAYSAMMGISMASLFMVYTNESIAKTFFITASVFGAMSIYGYSSRRDLSAYSSFFMMGLFGVIIASIVNYFMKSSGMEFIISIVTIAIFSFMTAYDTQRLKGIYHQVSGSADTAEKVAAFGALSLYLDFINLFMKLLYFFGDRRN